MILAFVLSACGNNGGVPYAPPSLAPTATAALKVGQLDTGFLWMGHTHLHIASVDGQTANGDEDHPVLLSPGPHKVLITAVRHPVLAYACFSFAFEAGKTYVAQSTKPFMETTTIWLEDAASGGIVGEKINATMIRDVALSSFVEGPHILFGSIPSC
jgi:hypothetical protein